MGRIDVCYGCEDRYPACHDHCEKYKEAKDKFNARKTEIYNGKLKDAVYQDYKRKKFKKYSRQV